MNRTDADRWRSEVLDEILIALAADNEIEQCLVFKGARVLNARLGGGRQSLDLNSNSERALLTSILIVKIRRVALKGT